MSSSKYGNLTQGPIARQLALFALPLLAGSLIQQLYSTVDMMFVGQALGKSAAAAVGSSSMIVTCIVGFFTGLSVGVGVSVGKAVGMGEEGMISRFIHCAAALTILLAMAFMGLALLLAPALLRWMDTPGEVMADAVAYIRIYLLSLFPIVSYNIGTGILKALGNSRDPMVYQLFGGVANVAGNALFICGLGWGVKGAALATVCSQSLAALLTVRHLFRLPLGYRLKPRQIRLDFALCREILSVGIPAAVQAIVISLSNVIVQANINRLGVESIAAMTAYYKVENIIYYPIMAVSQACSTFVSQNLGAGKMERARKGTRTALALGVGVTVSISAVVLVFAPSLFGLFAKDAAVIALGSKVARIAYPFYFTYVFLEVYASSIRGAGKALPTMVITVGNMCLVRVCALKLLLHFYPSILGVAAVYPLTWICTAFCMYLYYRSNRWIPNSERASGLKTRKRRVCG